MADKPSGRAHRLALTADGSELVPVSLYEATRSDADAESSGPTGVMAKICPQCRSRHDLAATFCGRDGAELVAIN